MPPVVAAVVAAAGTAATAVGATGVGAALAGTATAITTAAAGGGLLGALVTVGSYAICGAVIGGVVAAASGGDIGDGMLMGGLAGAVGGLVSVAAGALAPAAAVPPATTTAATTPAVTGGSANMTLYSGQELANVNALTAAGKAASPGLLNTVVTPGAAKVPAAVSGMSDFAKMGLYQSAGQIGTNLMDAGQAEKTAEAEKEAMLEERKFQEEKDAEEAAANRQLFQQRQGDDPRFAGTKAAMDDMPYRVKSTIQAPTSGLLKPAELIPQAGV